jgi:cell division protein FtsI (penicillin-binding protein 3)
MKNERLDILWRVFLVYFLMLLFGVAIIAKICNIQFVEGKELRKLSKEQVLQYFTVEAVRGNICSDEGSFLATSVPYFDIRLDLASPHITDKMFSDSVDVLARKVSRLFGDYTAAYYKKQLESQRKKGNRYFLLHKYVSYTELNRLKTFPILNRGKFRGGLIVIPKYLREYPFGDLAERTIGYEIKSEKLYVGLEGAYGDLLAGTEGRQLKRKMSNNDWRPVDDENDIEPQNGKDLLTTIDINIQDVAEDALLRHLLEHKAKWGCAILMEVKTGHIKAIANLTIDTVKKTGVEDYNYAIGQSIEPGSTFKLASMLAILEEDKIDLDDTISIGNGSMKMGSLEIKDTHPIRNGRITGREAFEHSSNVGTAKLVNKVFGSHPEKFVRYLQDFGLDKPLEVDLPGEAKPFINHPDGRLWSDQSIWVMPIGYEVRLTPLQILAFYNAVANGGRYVKPMFVTEIRQAGKTVRRFETEILNQQICKKTSAEKARSLLEGVVENGTAKELKTSVFKIAGKTGTAKIAQGKAGYKIRKYNATFVGYFPSDDPQYSCIVVVSEPSTGRYYASAVAVPVFKEIANKVYATHLEIKQDKDTLGSRRTLPVNWTGYQADVASILDLMNQPVDRDKLWSNWVKVGVESPSAEVRPLATEDQRVPDVTGMGLKDALYFLESSNMKVKIEGKGTVLSQSLPPGERMMPGQEILLRLGSGQQTH